MVIYFVSRRAKGALTNDMMGITLCCLFLRPMERRKHGFCLWKVVNMDSILIVNNTKAIDATQIAYLYFQEDCSPVGHSSIYHLCEAQIFWRAQNIHICLSYFIIVPSFVSKIFFIVTSNFI